MRNTFIDNLINHARKRENLVLIVGDLGYSVVEPFAEEFPDRFINVGVAEQNMTGIAAGLASEGYHVFTYSIANFPLFRCAEQLRNDVDYHNLPVTVVSVGGGLAYGNLGYSHHAIQDFSLVRSMPNMLIAAPGDPLEMEACVDYLINNAQPSYLRINKSGEPKIHDSIPALSHGGLEILQNGNNCSNLLLTTGAVLELAYDIWNTDENVKSNWAVGSIPIWGEKSREVIVDNLKDYKEIVTIEEHLLAGGFSSYLMELGLRINPFFLENDVCGAVGEQKYLLQQYGLNKNNILNFLKGI